MTHKVRLQKIEQEIMKILLVPTPSLSHHPLPFYTPPVLYEHVKKMVDFGLGDKVSQEEVSGALNSLIRQNKARVVSFTICNRLQHNNGSNYEKGGITACVSAVEEETRPQNGHIGTNDGNL